MSKFGNPVRVAMNETVLENGRYVTKMVIKDVDPRDNFKDFHYEDMQLDHLIAIGADLNDCGTVSTGFGAIDKLSGQLQDVENELDNKNNKK